MFSLVMLYPEFLTRPESNEHPIPAHMEDLMKANGNLQQKKRSGHHNFQLPSQTDENNL